MRWCAAVLSRWCADTKVPLYMTAGLKEMGLPCCMAFFQLTVGWFTHTSIVPLIAPINAQIEPGKGATAAEVEAAVEAEEDDVGGDARGGEE